MAVSDRSDGVRPGCAARASGRAVLARAASRRSAKRSSPALKLAEAQTPFDLSAVWRAYRACRRGKRNARDIQAYEARLLDKLVRTRDALANAAANAADHRAWRPSRTFSFVVSRPKLREIHAAPFSDRVAHHVIVERLARLYDPVFIHDSFANRLGKGTHAAVDRLQAFMRSASEGGSKPAYALQLDIANFFNCIHRPSLFRLLQTRLQKSVRQGTLPPAEATTLQALCRSLLTVDPTLGVKKRGAAGLFAQVPEHKRLGAMGPYTGLPIGNLTSQFFANVYLNELDQFVKHTLKCKYYVRFVDDFVLLHESQAQLVAWRAQIVAFLQDRLRLQLKAVNAPHSLHTGTDFLGYIVRPHYRLVRHRVVRHMHGRLAAFARAHVRANAMRLPPAAVALLRAQLASFIGHLRHANSQRLWSATLRGFPWLHRLFTFPSPLTLGESRLQCAAPRGIADQVSAAQAACPHARLLVQFGRGWWCADPTPIGLPAGKRVMRNGLGLGMEWPLAALPTLRRRCRARGIAHAVLAQTGHCKSGFKHRAVVACWQPVARTTNDSSEAKFSPTLGRDSISAAQGIDRRNAGMASQPTSPRL